jgi:hypothetical protein
MARIPGKLLIDLFPDGTVRLVFLPSADQRNASPVAVEDLYAAEILFMTCGLSVNRAAALRAEVKRNKIASADVTVDEEIVAKFDEAITHPARTHLPSV